MAAKQQQAKKGCSKMGRNKEYSAVRKLTGRDSINKAEKIAKHNKEQANHALSKEAKHASSPPPRFKCASCISSGALRRELVEHFCSKIGQAFAEWSASGFFSSRLAARSSQPHGQQPRRVLHQPAHERVLFRERLPSFLSKQAFVVLRCPLTRRTRFSVDPFDLGSYGGGCSKPT